MILTKKSLHTQPSCLKIGNDSIEYVTSAKNLGLHLSCDLSWRRHVNMQCGQVSGTLSVLRHSQHLLSPALKEHLIKALIVPKLLYCSNVFLGMPMSEWNTMKVCFNACVRFIFNLSMRTSISPYVVEVLGCSLKQLAEFRACTFLHQMLATQSPSYLYENLIFPRFQRGRTLKLPTPYSSKERNNSFFVLVPRFWNDLKPHLRAISTLSSFKSEYLSELNID